MAETPTRSSQHRAAPRAPPRPPKKPSSNSSDSSDDDEEKKVAAAKVRQAKLRKDLQEASGEDEKVPLKPSSAPLRF